MQDNSGLASITDPSIIQKATLQKCVKDSLNRVNIIKDDEDIMKWFVNYVKKCTNDKTKVVMLLHEFLFQYKTMNKIFPEVQIFYAMKCNPHPAIMDFFISMPGISFDCASIGEITTCIKGGVPANRIVFANPIKSDEAILFMREVGVWCCTVDSVEEIEKIHRVLGDDCVKCRIIVRVWVDDGHSTVQLGSKFGAHIEDIDEILQAIKKYGMDAVGVSFHVGSGNTNHDAYMNALKHTRTVFDKAANFGFTMNVIDLGGGWTGQLGGVKLENSDLSQLREVIHSNLQKYHFYDIPNLRLMNEPGRYFNEQTIYIACPILNVSKKGDRFIYRISEGVFGMFKDILLCDLSVTGIPLLDDNEKEEERVLYDSSIIGPSGDDMDIICKEIKLPHMKIGDSILFKSMGAYTESLTTTLLRNNHEYVYIATESSVSH